MLKRTGHGKAVDWYLFGVVMYELLVGIPPYYTTNKFFFIYKHLLNREELFENIKSAALKLPSYLSADAKSLLKSVIIILKNQFYLVIVTKPCKETWIRIK